MNDVIDPNLTPPYYRQTGFSADAAIDGRIRHVGYDASAQTLLIECTQDEAQAFISRLAVPRTGLMTVGDIAALLRGQPIEKRAAFVRFVLNGETLPDEGPAEMQPGAKRPEVPGAPPGVTRSAQAPTGPARSASVPEGTGAQEAHPSVSSEPASVPSTPTGRTVERLPDGRSVERTPMHAPTILARAAEAAAAPQRRGMDPAAALASYDRASVRQAAETANAENPPREGHVLEPIPRDPQSVLFEPEPGMHVRDAAHKNGDPPASTPQPRAPAVLDYARAPTPAAEPSAPLTSVLDDLGLGPATSAPAPAPRAQQHATLSRDMTPELPAAVVEAAKFGPLFEWLYECGFTTAEELATKSYDLREHLPFVKHTSNIEGRAQRWLELRGITPE